MRWPHEQPRLPTRNSVVVRSRAASCFLDDNEHVLYRAFVAVRLGRYTVLQHLASGGMAEVVLARSDGIEGFERHVVLKRIRPELARDKRFMRMFLDEARLAATLHHQNIVQVHDIGESDGDYFFAMEYVHGEDLRALLREHAKRHAYVPIPLVLGIIAGAAAGLHYAHERRGHDNRPLEIVHRDVSPANLLVGYDGSIKVVDFGVAKARSFAEALPDHVKGKLSYMAPEQLERGRVDRRTDVYSLGVVLYELATTMGLFRGENDAAVIDQILRGRVPLPRIHRPELSNELSTIIMTALAQDPDQRFQTADDLRTSLDAYAARLGMTVQPAQIGSYLRRMFGDRPEPWLELPREDDEPVDELLPTDSRSRLASSHDVVGSSPKMSAFARALSPVALTVAGLSTDRVGKVRPADSITIASADHPNATTRRGLLGAGGAVVAMLVALLAVIAMRGGERFATGTPSVANAARPVEQQTTTMPTRTSASAADQLAHDITRVAPLGEPLRDNMNVRPTPARTVTMTDPRTRTLHVADKPQPTKPAAARPVDSNPPIAHSELDPAEPKPVDDHVISSPNTNTAAAVSPSPAVALPPAQIQELANDMIERVASTHTRELSACENGAVLHGEIIVRFDVDANGQVRKPQVQTRGIVNMPKLSACVLRSVSGWRFAKQSADGARGTYTLSFQ